MCSSDLGAVNDPARPGGFIAKVNPKSGVASIAQQLRRQGIEVNGILFQLGARALLVHAKLKPGSYLFPLEASTATILFKMARCDSIKESIAFVPGTPIWQLRQMVDAHPALEHQTKGLGSAAFSKAVGLSQANAEGLFFPDTYVFDPLTPKDDLHKHWFAPYMHTFVAINTNNEIYATKEQYPERYETIDKFTRICI